LSFFRERSSIGFEPKLLNPEISIAVGNIRHLSSILYIHHRTNLIDTRKSRKILSSHLFLGSSIPDDEVAATLPMMQHAMQDAPFPAVLLSLPLQVDARAANNWDEAH
jgi:hypothetical protein